MPVFAVLASALTAAPWPDGDVTGRDREIVVRLTRGGIQRLDPDAGHGLEDAAEHAVAAAPVAYPLGAGVKSSAAAATAVLAVPPSVAPPVGAPLDTPRVVPGARRAPAVRRARARAPPAA